MSAVLIYKEALGIEIGDLYYASGQGWCPVIRIWGPIWWWFVGLTVAKFIYPYPIISITYRGRTPAGTGTINHLFRGADDRYYWFNGEELLFRKPKEHEQEDVAYPLFPSAHRYPERQQPYVWKEGIDYAAKVWCCKRCGDLNQVYYDEGRQLPRCPICQDIPMPLVHVIPPVGGRVNIQHPDWRGPIKGEGT